MGFLDSIKNRFSGNDGDEYYEDDYDDGYDDGYVSEPTSRRRDESTHLLDNTPRPEAESVSVYTRSGHPVGGSADTGSYDTSRRDSSYRSSSYSSAAETTSFRTSNYGNYDDFDEPDGFDGASATPSYDNLASFSGDAFGSSSASVDTGAKVMTRVTSGKLPPYVLKPVSYDDVQTVVRRVKTNQPVVVVFRNTNIETAKRILDFCFGLSFGIDGEVQELGDRVFVVLPQGIQLTDADINKLVADGDLVL